MEILGKILQDIYDNSQQKAKSYILSTFIIIFFIDNRKFFYSMLFIDSEYIYKYYHLTKIEYLEHILVDRYCVVFYFIIAMILYYLILPFLDGYISIRLLEDKVKQNEKEKARKIKLEEIKKEIAESRKKSAIAEIEAITEESNVSDIINENRNDKYKDRDKEFEKSLNEFNYGYILSSSLSSRNGKDRTWFMLNDIGIHKDEDYETWYIESLNEKGLYFFNKYKKEYYDKYLENQNELKEYNVNIP